LEVATRTNGCGKISIPGTSEESIPAEGPLRHQQEVGAVRSISSQVDGLLQSPHFVLLAVANITKTPSRLSLVLFRPITITTLLEVCNAWTSGIATNLVSLFGRNYYLSTSLERVPCPARPASHDIVNLVIKRRAYVTRPKDKQDTKYIEPVQDLSWCSGTVHIEDEVNMEGIKGTLEMVVGNPGRVGERNDGNSRKPRSLITLECSSSILDSLTEAVSCGFSM
jgi:hypothetical protein